MRLFKAEESQKQLINIEKLISERHIALEKVRSEFLAESTKLSEDFNKRKESFTIELISLQREVGNLEARKEEALKPLDEREKSLELKEKGVVAQILAVDTLKEELNTKERELQIKKEGIENTSSALHELKLSIDPLLARIKRQEAQLKKNEDNYAMREMDLARRTADLSTKEQEFQTFTVSERLVIEAERQHVKEGEKEIINIKRQLADQRETLERAFARLKKP